MIKQSISYPYSKINCYVFIGLFSYVAYIGLKLMEESISDKDIWGIVFAVFFCLFPVGMLIYISTKYFIPAMKGEIALEISDEGITDYVKNEFISWGVIQKIELRGTSSYSLYFTFRSNTDYSPTGRIPLQWVKGDDEKIFKTAIDYFENS